MTSVFGEFIIIKIAVVLLDLSPTASAALKSLDEEPVKIEHSERTIEYSRPIEEHERQ